MKILKNRTAVMQLAAGLMISLVGTECIATSEIVAQAPTIVGWLGEPERRLRSQIGDLVQVEESEIGQRVTKSTVIWESYKFNIGDWGAMTTFHVVDGRVKRIWQEATAAQKYCDQAAEWGTISTSLSEELGLMPMVYPPSGVSGKWQQAALWHAPRVTVVLYRTLDLDGECRVRMTVQ